MRKNSFVATRKEFFLLELLQTLLPIQLKKLNRLRHYTYCIFKIHLKFSLIKVQHAIFWDIAITSLAVLKDVARYELWNQLEHRFSLRKNEPP